MKKARFEQEGLSVEQKSENVCGDPLSQGLRYHNSVSELWLRASGDTESLGLQPEKQGCEEGPWLLHQREMHHGWGRFFRQIPGTQLQGQILQKWWIQMTEMPWGGTLLRQMAGNATPGGLPTLWALSRVHLENPKRAQLAKGKHGLLGLRSAAWAEPEEWVKAA